MGGVRLHSSGAAIAVLAVAIGALALLAAACGGDDDELRSFGAPDAHEVILALDVHDDWLGWEGQAAPDVPPYFALPTHTDLTIRLRNLGSTVHTLTLYGSEDARDVLASSPPIPPGEEGTIQFHFHDPMSVLLRDDAKPSEIHARIEATR